MGCVVVRNVAASEQEGSWLKSQLGLFCVELHVLPEHGYSGFLPPSKNMHVRLTGDPRSECERDCVSRLSLCGPVMDWRPLQGVTLPNFHNIQIAFLFFFLIDMATKLMRKKGITEATVIQVP